MNKNIMQLWIIILSIFIVNVSFAQQEIAKEVNVGDIIPDVKLNNVLNYSSNSLSLSDFKGKLIIIDFWATWCGPCIGAFTKLDSIQAEFDGELQVISVTNEKKEIVERFFDQMKKMKRKTPMTAVDEHGLTSLFRHIYLPHYVWIDGKGKVIAITEAKDVTRDNIKKAIEGRDFVYKLKKDITVTVVSEIDNGTPIISPGIKINENGKIQFTKMSDTLLFTQTTLTHTIEGIPPGTFADTGMIGVWNSPVIWLYKVAFWKHGVEMMNEKKTIADIDNLELYKIVTACTKDGQLVVSPGLEYRNWLESYGYCYQLKVPIEMEDQKFDIMIDELNRFFSAKLGIEGQIEKRKSASLTLIRTSNEDKIATQNGNAQSQADITKLFLQVKNYKISGLLAQLAQPLQEEPPLVDETGYKGSIDIQLRCDITNVVELNKELAKYDLKLIRKEIFQDIGVIKVKGGNKAKL